jgi:hypothetical protein
LVLASVLSPYCCPPLGAYALPLPASPSEAGEATYSQLEGEEEEEEGEERRREKASRWAFYRYRCRGERVPHTRRTSSKHRKHRLAFLKRQFRISGFGVVAWRSKGTRLQHAARTEVDCVPCSFFDCYFCHALRTDHTTQESSGAKKRHSECRNW